MIRTSQISRRKDCFQTAFINNPSVSHEINLVDVESFKKQSRKHLVSHDKYCFVAVCFGFFCMYVCMCVCVGL